MRTTGGLRSGLERKCWYGAIGGSGIDADAGAAPDDASSRPTATSIRDTMAPASHNPNHGVVLGDRSLVPSLSGS